MRYLAVLAIAATLGSACSGSSPSSPTPSILQVAGLWAYSVTLTSVSGGECVGSALRATSIGAQQTGTIEISQSGAALTAIVTDDSAGESCTYTGTAGTDSIALNTTSCTASNVSGLVCPDGTVRNVVHQTGGYSATVSGASMSGTGTDTYNVTTDDGAPIEAMTLNATFTATRR